MMQIVVNQETIPYELKQKQFFSQKLENRTIRKLEPFGLGGGVTQTLVVRGVVNPELIYVYLPKAIKTSSQKKIWGKIGNTRGVRSEIFVRIFPYLYL